MKKVTVKKRQLDTSKLESWLVEDTHDFDIITFEVDEDLDGLNLYLIFVNSEGTGGVEKLDGNEWCPSHLFTAVKGTVRVQLVATEDETYSKTSDIRWSSISSSVTMNENIETDDIVDEPVQSVIENLICEEINEDSNN